MTLAIQAPQALRITAYQCPLCNYTAKHWKHLKFHTLKHSLKACPACGKRCRNVKGHLAQMASRDTRHAIMHGLFLSNRHRDAKAYALFRRSSRAAIEATRVTMPVSDQILSQRVCMEAP